MSEEFIPVYTRLLTQKEPAVADIYALYTEQTNWFPTDATIVNAAYLKTIVIQNVIQSNRVGTLLMTLHAEGKVIPQELLQALPLTPEQCIQLHKKGVSISETQYLTSILTSDLTLPLRQKYLTAYRARFEPAKRPNTASKQEFHPLLYAIWRHYPLAMDVFHLDDVNVRHQWYDYAIHQSAMAVHLLLETPFADEFKTWFVPQYDLFFPDKSYHYDVIAYLRSTQPSLWAAWQQNGAAHRLADIIEDAYSASLTWALVDYLTLHDGTEFPDETYLKAYRALLPLTDANATAAIPTDEDYDDYLIFVEDSIDAMLRKSPGLVKAFVEDLADPEYPLYAINIDKLAELSLQQLLANNDLDFSNPRHKTLFANNMPPDVWLRRVLDYKLPPTEVLQGLRAYSDPKIREFFTGIQFWRRHTGLDGLSFGERLYQAETPYSPELLILALALMAPEFPPNIVIDNTPTPVGKTDIMARTEMPTSKLFNRIFGENAVEDYKMFVAGYTDLMGVGAQDAYIAYSLQKYREIVGLNTVDLTVPDIGALDV